jgi:DNA modification methylase
VRRNNNKVNDGEEKEDEVDYEKNSRRMRSTSNKRKLRLNCRGRSHCDGSFPSLN